MAMLRIGTTCDADLDTELTVFPPCAEKPVTGEVRTRRVLRAHWRAYFARTGTRLAC